MSRAFPPGTEPVDLAIQRSSLRYTICTCVTRSDDYAEMVASFRAAGFTEPDCEFLYADNTEANRHDAYAAFNLFLRAARGEYIVLCHQDIVVKDPRARLDSAIEQVTQLDAAWGVLGNAGVALPDRKVARISDPYGTDRRKGGPFPAAVSALDENFLVVRAAANLAVSGDLHGFHLYATDLCLIADILGYRAYVVDFHVWHKSRGNWDASFWLARNALIRKYATALRPRLVASPSNECILTPSALLNSLANRRFVRRSLVFLLKLTVF